jgi:hypothetical protein
MCVCVCVYASTLFRQCVQSGQNINTYEHKLQTLILVRANARTHTHRQLHAKKYTNLQIHAELTQRTCTMMHPATGRKNLSLLHNEDPTVYKCAYCTAAQNHVAKMHHRKPTSMMKSMITSITKVRDDIEGSDKESL